VYLPKQFAARDRAAVEAFVDSAGAADLVTFDGTKPIASLIPVIWDRTGGGLGGAVGSGSAVGGAVGSGSAVGGAVGSGSAVGGAVGSGSAEHGRLLGHLALQNPPPPRHEDPSVR
jgi:predicted FMN-binding regulatory protein PaiB